MRRYSSFLLLFLSSRKSSFLRSRVGNARQRVLLADCFPIACITIVQDSPPVSSPPPFPFLSTVFFFLRLRQRRSCCQFPRGRRELRRERRVLAELRRQFYFPPTSIFRTVPIPGSVDCECTAHARALLSGYTVYSRALRYIEDIYFLRSRIKELKLVGGGGGKYRAIFITMFALSQLLVRFIASRATLGTI